MDLRGADLRGSDLSQLPLACIITGQSVVVTNIFTERDVRSGEASAIHFEEAELSEAHLEGAALSHAHFEGATLRYARFEGSFLPFAHFEHAILIGADCNGTSLENAHFDGAWAAGADFTAADLEGASFRSSSLADACFERCNLHRATMDGASLHDAHFNDAHLLDTQWGDAGLSAVNWVRVKVGEESEATRPEFTDEDSIGKAKTKEDRIYEYRDAVRANRQLATALRNQGLNEDANPFAYRALVLQRVLLRRQRHRLRYLGSLLLDLMAGYGYKPLRSFVTYLLVVGGFAFLYFLMRASVHPALTPVDAIVFSITSFQGRGFNPGESVSLHNPLTIEAAIEAIIGLLIEIAFIATFTQRFFTR